MASDEGPAIRVRIVERKERESSLKIHETSEVLTSWQFNQLKRTKLPGRGSKQNILI